MRPSLTSALAMAPQTPQIPSASANVHLAGLVPIVAPLLVNPLPVHFRPCQAASLLLRWMRLNRSCVVVQSVACPLPQVISVSAPARCHTKEKLALIQSVPSLRTGVHVVGVHRVHISSVPLAAPVSAKQGGLVRLVM